MMLPTETLAEAVAFLHLFDLDALAVANSLCSTLARKASRAIRWEKFPDLKLFVVKQSIHVRRTSRPEDENGQSRRTPVTVLTFQSADETAEFIAAVFRNCIFDDVLFPTSVSKLLLDAMDRVADCVVISGVFHPPYGMSPDHTVKLVRKLRKVKVSFGSLNRSVSITPGRF